MKRSLFLSLAVAALLQASEIQDLLHKLKGAPVTQTQKTSAKIAKLYAKKVTDKLYPDIAIFGSYEHYTNDTNLRPVPPTEANLLIAQHQPIPFAQNIQRIGAKFSMPIFVKSLFTLRKKADYLVKAAQLKAKLNLLQNEALLVGAYAQLIYLQELQKALLARKKALEKTKEDIAIKVQSGRAAPIALDKITNIVSSIDIALVNVATNRAKAISVIESLVDTKPSEIAPLHQKNALDTATLYAIKPLEAKAQAEKKALQASKEQFLPKLLAEGSYAKSYAQNDVLFGKDVDEGYGYVALKLIIPLSKSSFTDIQIAKAKLMQSNKEIAQKHLELTAKAKALQKELQLNEKAQQLAAKQVASQKNLLKYAKTAFEVGRMDEEEYLRYETALLEAQTKLAQTRLQKWQIIAQLAVIYGNDLERIIQ